MTIPCPLCQRPSDSIKTLRCGVLVFLGIAGFWRTWTETGCRSCLRGRLLALAGMNVLSANLLWPIAVLPWFSVQFLRTGLRGHSPDVCERIGVPVPPRTSLWKQLQAEQPTAFRIIGAVQLILGLAFLGAVAWFIGETWFRYRRIEFLIAGSLIAIASAAACYLCVTGIAKVLGLAPGVWMRVILAAAAGFAIPMGGEAIATLAWIPKERALYAAAVESPRGSEIYILRVPPKLWRPEAVRPRLRELLQSRPPGAVWATYELSSLRARLRDLSSTNPEFAAMYRQIDEPEKPVGG